MSQLGFADEQAKNFARLFVIYSVTSSRRRLGRAALSQLPSLVLRRVVLLASSHHLLNALSAVFMSPAWRARMHSSLLTVGSPGYRLRSALMPSFVRGY